MTAHHPVIASLALLLVLRGGSALGQERESAVAIVSALTGTASVTVPRERKPTRLSLFDRLSAGSAIEVGRGSTLTLVFSSGARYELGETATATAGLRSLTVSSGPVRDLEPVPPLPRLSPIAENARQAPRSGAVRIRGATIFPLYPDTGASTLADRTVLRFTAVPDASRYRVDVETESGKTVFQGETRSSTVSISPGILKPGVQYYWQVRTVDRIGQVARGAAEFVTLGAETARARAGLAASLELAGDASSLALMAEIDRSLGLLIEAREKFRVAVAKAPGDIALRQALDRLEQQLAADQPKPEK